MAKAKKNIIEFDFETDGLKDCQPVQIGAVVIEPMNLELIKGSEFCSMMKPIDINREDYYDNHVDCIKWHAKNYGISPEEIFNNWHNAPDQKTVWQQFAEFVKKYKTSTSHWSCPIPAGKNIRRFDLPIVNKLNDKYKIKTMFHPHHSVDLEDFTYYWLEFLNDGPISYSMDNLRIFFGLDTNEIAHDALGDARETAIIIQRFLRLHKSQANKIPFKNAFK